MLHLNKKRLMCFFYQYHQLLISSLCYDRVTQYIDGLMKVVLMIDLYLALASSNEHIEMDQNFVIQANKQSKLVGRRKLHQNKDNCASMKKLEIN